MALASTTTIILVRWNSCLLTAAHFLGQRFSALCLLIDRRIPLHNGEARVIPRVGTRSCYQHVPLNIQAICIELDPPFFVGPIFSLNG